MINKWILDNFKSINREKTLPFRKLTIFTGANSSGKSTILQSILLVSQTLQNNNASRSIILNGWYKKFGSYTDIVNCKDISKNIKIGFSFSDSEEWDEYLWFSRRYGMHIDFLDDSADEDMNINCEFVISSAGKKENLHPELESVLIETVQGGKQTSKVEVTKRTSLSDTEAKVLDTIKDKFSEEELSYAIKSNQNGFRMPALDDMKLESIGVGLNHFLPDNVIGYCRREDHAKRILKEFLMTGHYYYQVEDIEKEINPIIKDKALEVVEQLFSKDLVRSKHPKKNHDAIKKNFSLKRFQNIIKNSALDDAEKTKYVNQVVDRISGAISGFMVRRSPLYSPQGLESIRNFFRSRIKYLGPLREEPKSLYPLNNDSSLTEVGLKGENTAAVYDNNKHMMVQYIDPDDFKTIKSGTPKPKEGRLSEAVNKWLIYMGVADDIVTSDRGKIGHSMQISNGLNIKQDLTHVGVGVSQVLPILVMSLLSKKGDVVILEQPELHLHPKVQTRLADFFVSMNLIDKQCIVETHSEYMINRLRYLVAITEDSTIADNTMMYFVERDKAEGYSKYRQVTINRYGVIEDWPDGFFDESERIASQILRAGMEKRMKEEGDEEDDE